VNIALLTPEWHEADSGGIATYCRTLAEYATSRGHHVSVIAGGTTIAAPTDAMPGLRVTSVGANHSPARDVAAAMRNALAELIAVGPRPDVVEAAEFGGVAAMIDDLPAAPPLVTRLHTPLAVILERNQGQRIYRDDDDRRELESRQVALSSALTSPSAWLAREAMQLWDLPVKPTVLPNPIRWVPALRRRRHPGALRVLYVGRLEYRKGAQILAKAARLWFATGGEGEVIFAGQDTTWYGTPMSAVVSEALGPFCKPPTCRILGRVSHAAVAELIRSADLVALPSLYENFSYACLEAMVAGTAVVATTGSGFDEILDDGRTGFLVPPADPCALAAVLRRAGRDPSALAPVAAAARAAARRFSVRACGRRIVSHLQQVAMQGRSTTLMGL
jgi:glycogen synthase